MPRESERQRLLNDIVEALAAVILEADNDEEDMDCDELSLSPVEELYELLLIVDCSRYLNPRASIPRCIDFRTIIFLELPDNSFRQIARMTKRSFHFVLSEIEAHPVFQNRSTCPQAPVWQQLAVALDRLGNYGNGASSGRSMHMWGIGKGTCDLYLARVLLALDSLAPKYVRWPSPRERLKMSKRMAQKGFAGCVGFIDGTTIPLSQKPGEDGSCFFDRKHRYSINAQVICDDRRRIIGFFSGWAGSCADSTVYREMDLAQDERKRDYFSPGEYLIADSAYPADHTHNTIVPSYRSSSKGTDNEDFNTCVAHVRVVNEHTIGIIKNRFGSLKELRVQIKKKEDMTRALLWMKGPVVLHNMLIKAGDEWEDDDWSDESDEESEEDEESEDEDEDTYLFRRQLKRRAIAVGWQPNGILWYNSRKGN